MTKEDIIRMAREADLVAWLPNSSFSNGIWWIEAHEVGSELERFAALVASAERERIKQANVPEIERVNAHIKELEDSCKKPEQEPVAWRHKQFFETQEGWFYADWHSDGINPPSAELLYTTPPQRTWVGLTFDERIELAQDVDWPAGAYCEYAEKIEAKLKEKNT